MLNDLKYITQHDTSDMLGAIANQPDQLTHTFKLSGQKTDIKQVLVCALGGSSVGARIIQNWANLSVPVIICAEADIPTYLTPHSLVIAASYSGTTAETITAFKAAQKTGARLAVITSGGKLAELGTEYGADVLTIPPSRQGRMTTWYNLTGLAAILRHYEVITTDQQAELQAAHTHLARAAQRWTPDSSSEANQAKEIAEEIAGKTLVTYSGARFSAATYKWKIGANENAKNVAYANVLPEMNHNELLGWTSHPVEKPFAILQLQSSYDNPDTTRRVSAMNRVLSGTMPHPIQVHAQGESHIEQLLWLCLLSDFTTTYLGIINGIDPTPTKAVDAFKKLL